MNVGDLKLLLWMIPTNFFNFLFSFYISSVYGIQKKIFFMESSTSICLVVSAIRKKNFQNDVKIIPLEIVKNE